jgi:hypothetical protein
MVELCNELRLAVSPGSMPGWRKKPQKRISSTDLIAGRTPNLDSWLRYTLPLDLPAALLRLSRYMFRPRSAQRRDGKRFASVLPAVGNKAAKTSSVDGYATTVGSVPRSFGPNSARFDAFIPAVGDSQVQKVPGPYQSGLDWLRLVAGTQATQS